jgi:hypothetical protein
MDLFVIPLDGHEMVLGVQWLRTLGPILWDFNRAHMSCWRDDHCVEWQGVPTRHEPAAVRAAATSNLMDLLLEEYATVFDMPIGLSPPCHHNHHIHLLPDMPPIVVWPYRFPQLVKDELER